MRVRDGMTKTVVTVGPLHDLATTARMMAEHNVGAAIIVDPETNGPGIITERDLLRAVARDSDLAAEKVADHAAERVVYAAPDWSLERAAAEMVRGGFRHLVVVDGGDVVGILSMRDIVRCWTADWATAEVERR